MVRLFPQCKEINIKLKSIEKLDKNAETIGLPDIEEEDYEEVKETLEINLAEDIRGSHETGIIVKPNKKKKIPGQTTNVEQENGNI
ncbi:hypothetical protein FQA39_LY06495 [Lamprigera yunnana]|nr:hypothetical protein FQA39_LY06495 [Lamprigera yunnana]